MSSQFFSGRIPKMTSVLGMAFVPYYKELIHLLDTNKELNNSVRAIAKQAAWPAGLSAVGGILLGKKGALIGGAAGLLIGYLFSDQYTPMIKVLKNLKDEDKKKVVKAVQELVRSSSINALTSFIKNPVGREQLIKVIRDVVAEIKKRRQ